MHARASHRTQSRASRGRWPFALVLVAALTASTVFAQPAPTRVGYVDMQRLLDNAPQVLAANARLKREFDARDAELTADQARLAELDARIASADADDLAELRRQADALRRTVERTRERLREELRTRSDEEVDKTWPLINEAVADYAREQGYDLVVPSPVVYVSGRIDITDDVIERMRREFSENEP